MFKTALNFSKFPHSLVTKFIPEVSKKNGDIEILKRKLRNWGNNLMFYYSKLTQALMAPYRQ